MNQQFIKITLFNTTKDIIYINEMSQCPCVNKNLRRNVADVYSHKLYRMLSGYPKLLDNKLCPRQKIDKIKRVQVPRVNIQDVKIMKYMLENSIPFIVSGSQDLQKCKEIYDHIVTNTITTKNDLKMWDDIKFNNIVSSWVDKKEINLDFDVKNALFSIKGVRAVPNATEVVINTKRPGLKIMHCDHTGYMQGIYCVDGDKRLSLVPPEYAHLYTFDTWKGVASDIYKNKNELETKIANCSIPYIYVADYKAGECLFFDTDLPHYAEYFTGEEKAYILKFFMYTPSPIPNLHLPQYRNFPLPAKRHEAEHAKTK